MRGRDIIRPRHVPLLEAIEGDRVVFEMTTSQSPVKVLSVGDPAFVHVVMPMFL